MASAILWLFFAAVASGHCFAQTPWTQYDPVIRIGAAHWKNILFILWSHDSKASANAISRVLRSLGKDIQTHNIIVYLYQIAPENEDKLKEASLFLCVPVENYPKVVFRYMDLLAKLPADYDPAEFKALIARAGKGNGLPRNTRTCTEGRLGMERQVALRTHREALRRNYHFKELPAYVLNGRSITVHSVADIRELLLKD